MERTRDQPDKRIRFFKIMEPGHFEQHLMLPPKFCKKIKKEKGKTATLEGCKGKFKACVRRSRGPIKLDGGWPQFVAANGLSGGDLLVFEHTQNLHFNVSVFDASSMLKKHFLDHPTNHYQHCCNTPGFNVQVRPHTPAYADKVCIPMEFVREFGLRQKTEVEVGDDRGRSWRIKLLLQQRSTYLGGWRAFCQGNELQIGDVCRFELQRDSRTPLFRVKIERCSAPEN